MGSKFYIISGIQGDYGDLSNNMVKSIASSDLLFVEEITIFNKLVGENNIGFKGKLVELNNDFNLKDHKKKIILHLLNGKNVGLFESSGAACFIDPGYEIVEYIYSLKDSLKDKLDFKIKPIPGSSALTLAISCSGFDIVNFQFLGFIGEDSKDEILSSNIPSIYFNQKDTIEKLNKCIGFMKDITDRKAFVGLNLGKVGVDKSNTFIRGTYSEVYKELNEMCKGDDRIVDLTFIFN